MNAGGIISGELWRADLAGNLLDDLTQYVNEQGEGTVEWSADRAGGTAMTCRFAMRRADLLTPLVDYVVPYLVIDYDDGRSVRSQIGQFLVEQPSERFAGLSADSRYPLINESTVMGSDLTRLLAESTFLDTVTYPAGTNFITAITGILTGAGITRYAFRASTKTMGYGRTFRPGTTRLEAVNKLLTAIGWYPLYMDLSGWLTSRPYKRLALESPAKTYDATSPAGPDGAYSVEVEPTLGQIANTVVVINDRATAEPIIATAVNDDPASPYSTVNVGRQILPPGGIIQSSEVEDQEAADALAAHELEKARQYERTVRLAVLPDPRPPLFDVVVIHIDTPGTNLYGNYAVNAWTMGFTPAQAGLQLTLGRFVRAGFGEDRSAA